MLKWTDIYYKNRTFTQKKFDLDFNPKLIDELRNKNVFIKHFQEPVAYESKDKLIFRNSAEGGYVSNYCEFDKSRLYGSIQLFGKSISLNEVRFMILEYRGKNTQIAPYVLKEIDFYNENIHIGLQNDYKNAIQLTFLNHTDENVIVNASGSQYTLQRIYDNAIKALIQDCEENRTLANVLLNAIKTAPNFEQLKARLIATNELGILKSKEYYGN